MLRAIVKNVFVDFVGDREHVKLDAEIADQSQFLSREYLACWVVGRIDDDGFGRLAESAAKFFFVEGPLAAAVGWLSEFYVHWFRAAQFGVRPVILVERFEHHDLVAGVADCQQGRDHGFGRAAADRDILFGINRNALPQAHLAGDGLAQILRTPGNGVLINVGGYGALRSLFDFGRGGEIGEALRQVDRAVQHGLPRHFTNHGFREVGDAIAEEMLLYAGRIHEIAFNRRGGRVMPSARRPAFRVRQ